MSRVIREELIVEPFSNNDQEFFDWCSEEYEKMVTNILNCRHVDNAPCSNPHYGNCLWSSAIGVVKENGKGPRIKKNTLYPKAYAFWNRKHSDQQKQFTPSGTSTKVSVLHIAFFASLATKDPEDQQRALLDLDNENNVIRHLCGCGYSGTLRSCLNNHHLAVGSKMDNELDKYYHGVMEKECVTSDRYEQFMEFCNQLNGAF